MTEHLKITIESDSQDPVIFERTVVALADGGWSFSQDNEYIDISTGTRKEYLCVGGTLIVRWRTAR